MIELNKIYNEDCLEGMKRIDDKSIDMILCDLPYGTTACHWDTIIPFDALWNQYKRIIKDNGAIVLTGSQPFTSMLIMSNLEWFKYEWIWIKSKAGGMMMAKYRPMKKHENIIVFSNGIATNNQFTNEKIKYNPQGLIESNKICKGKDKITAINNIRGNTAKDYLQTHINYPNSILQFNNDINGLHPTAKPVALFEYLIRTYTNENETVLDNCMGSGTTAIACINTSRNYIGFELDAEYHAIAEKRISDYQQQQKLEL